MLISYISLVVYLLIGRIAFWSLSVTVALVVGRERSLLTMIVVSMVVGLIEDIVRVRPLGLTSTFLVTLSCVVWLIERQYRSKWLWWWFVIGIVGDVMFRLIMHLPFSVSSILGQLLALGAIHWITLRLTETEGIYVGR